MTEKKLELIKCNYLDFDSFLEGVWVINFKFNIPGSSYIQLIFIYLHLLNQQQNATNITNISCRIPG